MKRSGGQPPISRWMGQVPEHAKVPHEVVVSTQGSSNAELIANLEKHLQQHVNTPNMSIKRLHFSGFQEATSDNEKGVKWGDDSHRHEESGASLLKRLSESTASRQRALDAASSPQYDGVPSSIAALLKRRAETVQRGLVNQQETTSSKESATEFNSKKWYYIQRDAPSGVNSELLKTPMKGPMGPTSSPFSKVSNSGTSNDDALSFDSTSRTPQRSIPAYDTMAVQEQLRQEFWSLPTRMSVSCECHPRQISFMAIYLFSERQRKLATLMQGGSGGDGDSTHQQHHPLPHASFADIAATASRMPSYDSYKSQSGSSNDFMQRRGSVYTNSIADLAAALGRIANTTVHPHQILHLNPKPTPRLTNTFSLMDAFPSSAASHRSSQNSAPSDDYFKPLQNLAQCDNFVYLICDLCDDGQQSAPVGNTDFEARLPRNSSRVAALLENRGINPKRFHNEMDDLPLPHQPQADYNAIRAVGAHAGSLRYDATIPMDHVGSQFGGDGERQYYPNSASVGKRKFEDQPTYNTSNSIEGAGVGNNVSRHAPVHEQALLRNRHDSPRGISSSPRHERNAVIAAHFPETISNNRNIQGLAQGRNGLRMDDDSYAHTNNNNTGGRTPQYHSHQQGVVASDGRRGDYPTLMEKAQSSTLTADFRPQLAVESRFKYHPTSIHSQFDYEGERSGTSDATHHNTLHNVNNNNNDSNNNAVANVHRRMTGDLELVPRLRSPPAPASLSAPTGRLSPRSQRRALIQIALRQVYGSTPLAEAYFTSDIMIKVTSEAVSRFMKEVYPVDTQMALNFPLSKHHAAHLTRVVHDVVNDWAPAVLGSSDSEKSGLLARNELERAAALAQYKRKHGDFHEERAPSEEVEGKPDPNLSSPQAPVRVVDQSHWVDPDVDSPQTGNNNSKHFNGQLGQRYVHPPVEELGKRRQLFVADPRWEPEARRLVVYATCSADIFDGTSEAFSLSKNVGKNGVRPPFRWWLRTGHRDAVGGVSEDLCLDGLIDLGIATMHVVTRTAPITLCLEINLNPEHNFTIIEAAIQKRVSANGKGNQSLFSASNSTEWNIAQKTKAAKIHFDEIHRVLINRYLKASNPAVVRGGLPYTVGCEIFDRNADTLFRAEKTFTIPKNAGLEISEEDLLKRIAELRYVTYA